MVSDDVVWESRMAKVQAILRSAADDDGAAFGGVRLWELPLDKLLRAELLGVRLIAAARPAKAGGSCCHCEPAAEGPSRSSESGLVRGLRGERPFDGSQLPRLPWGKKPVSADDLQVIADWIDAGCPADGREVDYPTDVTASAQGTILVDKVPEIAESPGRAAITGSNEYKTQRGELKQRLNIDCMSPAQIDTFRRAFRELYKLNAWPEDARNYNNIALVHQNHCQHGWERFLTWHRVYLYEFEQALQDHFPEVTLPYWDFTMDQYRPEDPTSGRIIPFAFQGFLTQESLVFLGKNGIPTDALQDMVDSLYVTLTSFFEDVAKRIGTEYTTGTPRERFIDALLATNSLWYPLRYPAQYKDGGTINSVIHYHYPTAEDIEQIMSLRTYRDFGGGNLYNDSFGFLDQNPHNTMHIWTGGMNPAFGQNGPIPTDRNRSVVVAGRRFHSRKDLYSQPEYGDMFSNLTASYDPVFWPIHANIDRLWSEWQKRHPDSAPADLDAVLTPWSYTAGDTLDTARFGYEYVRSAYVLPIGMDAPVGRYVSRDIDVPPEVRGTFREAEVRLHRVPQLPRSCFIRVFLNLPDATAETPLDDPHYAGYLAVFGHGACYGGPGHCDVPTTPRKFDLRPRSHNTPRNHRINVTKRAKALFESGATSLRITLVVIGADYREDRELLRLEGVSLNFLD